MIPIRRLALSALAATALGLVGAAPAPADPVLAAAGDIACAPTSPFFLGGNGDATHCAQKRTAALTRSSVSMRCTAVVVQKLFTPSASPAKER